MGIATLRVQFGDGVDSSLLALAFLDETLNVDSAGNAKSQFLPGDTPYFLVHLDDRLAVSNIVCSSGTVRNLGRVVRSAQQDFDVATADDSQDLGHIPFAPPAFFWYGNAPTVSLQDRTLSFSGALPAAGSATYQYYAWSYQYVPPALGPTQEWRTLIVVHVESAI